MKTRQAFAAALRRARRHRGVSQEALGWEVSGRTYISALERGLKSPTLQKIDVLATAIDIHPVALVALTYLLGAEGGASEQAAERLLEQVRAQIEEVLADEG